MMTEDCFAKSKGQPASEEIRSALGTCFPLWERLTSFIEKSYQIEGKWSKWGPAQSGWNLRYRRKGRSLAALHPQREGILAQIVLGKAQAERALKLELGEKASRMLREAPQLRDGRWLLIPVTNSFSTSSASNLLVTGIRSQRPSRNCGASRSILKVFSPSSSLRERSA